MSCLASDRQNRKGDNGMLSDDRRCNPCPKRYVFMNTYVNALTMGETLEEVESIIKKRLPTQHVVINAFKINLMESDPALKAVVNDCPLVNADGASIVWAAKVLGVPVPERVAGIDLFLHLVELAASKGYKVYLFGATEEVVSEVKTRLEDRFPGVEIVGARNGYFDETDEEKIVEDIASSGADMVFVAFSSPKKEFWVNKYLDQLNVPFVMGVGGSFDVVAGKTSRAPQWMQDHGLEWLYRFIQEPRRLWRRYIVGNIRFVRLVWRYRKKPLNEMVG